MSIRLWSEIPEDQRGSEADLRSRMGWVDVRWRNVRLRLLQTPQCLAATKYQGGIWYPCVNKPKNGTAFCKSHWRHVGLVAAFARTGQ